MHWRSGWGGTSPHRPSPFSSSIPEETSYSIIDRATRSEMGRLPLGREPHHIAVTPDGKEVLLASTVTNDLVGARHKTGEQRRIVRDIVDPYQLGFSPDGKWFVTVANRLDHIDIYRAADSSS